MHTFKTKQSRIRSTFIFNVPKFFYYCIPPWNWVSLDKLDQFFTKQTTIPVRCVPPTFLVLRGFAQLPCRQNPQSGCRHPPGCRLPPWMLVMWPMMHAGKPTFPRMLVMWPVMHAGKPTPLNRMTYTYKKLPCPKLRLRAVKIESYVSKMLTEYLIINLVWQP